MKKNRQMEDKHKKFINKYFPKAWDSKLNYKDITLKVNTKFGTKYSVYQVAGYLGRQIQLHMI